LCRTDDRREGKIHYIGLSEISAGTLYRASKVHHIDAVQIEYSPFSLDIESPQIGLLKACRELGVAVVGYSPLGRGFLTGTIKSPADLQDGDGRKTILPRFSEENFPKNLVLAEQLEELARQKNVTPSQLVLAWILAQGNDIIPIP
jgi:aryl-alcohol dehydrogenase-like predicted oxidoreductase